MSFCEYFVRERCRSPLKKDFKSLNAIVYTEWVYPFPLYFGLIDNSSPLKCEGSIIEENHWRSAVRPNAETG